jgi:Mrp family chromosome partitioning ATPase
MPHIPTEDPEFPRLSGVLRRRALPLLLAAGLAGGAAYLLAARQAPSYDAVSRLLAVRPDGGNDRVNASVFAAPSLPRGTLTEALQSRSVLQAVRQKLETPSAPPATVEPLQRALDAQLAGGAPGSLSVQALSDGQQDGLFEVHGNAATALGAQLLAEAGAGALLEWDAQRAQTRLEQLRSNLQRQIGLLDTRLARPAPSPTAPRAAQLEWQTLTDARSQVAQSLAQVTALQQSTTGSLERLAPATLPNQPLSPRPLRSAVLAGLLALLLGTGIALLHDRSRRTIYSEADLRAAPYPLLGSLPALGLPALGPGQTGEPVLSAVRSGVWQAPVGFLGVNVRAQLAASASRRVVLSGTRQGDGSSTVTAALAASLAGAGRRVLIVDAGPRHPAQSTLWNAAPDVQERHFGAQIGGTGSEVTAQTLNVAEHIDLLPATALRGGSLDLTELGALLSEIESAYDLVLIDAPPLLASPEAVTLAAQAAGLILLLVPGETSQHDLEAAFAVAGTANARILGLALNQRPAQAKLARTASLVPAASALGSNKVSVR